MKSNKLMVLIIIILLVNTVLVNADSLYLTDTIKTENAGPGEYDKTYALNGNEYTFEYVLCNQEGNKCSVIINGKTTGPLSILDTYNLDDNYFFKIESIIFDFCDNARFCDYHYEAYDILEFSIYSKKSFCGDGKCIEDKTCQSCPEDCGECCGNGECESNYDEDCYTCNEDCGKCEPVCGDGICTPRESCEEDNCCKGIKVVDFDNDKYNCGGCGIHCKGFGKCENGKCIQICGNNYCESKEDCKTCEEDCGKCKEVCGDGICQSSEDCNSCTNDCSCKSYEKCKSGKCAAYCGNKICESNEDCSSCLTDCGCKKGYECFSKICVAPECNNDSDCDDKDACTSDTCSGTPKKCSNKRDASGCNFNYNCIPIGTRTENRYCNIENSMENLKSENEKCNNNYECSSNVCVNNQCISPSLIQKIINWFKRLFG